MSWTRPQRRAVAIAALAIVIDGIDTQLLSVSIPSLAADWGIPRGSFGPVLALGVLGGGLGVVAGPLGDRFGRRPVLLGSILLFALATLATAAVGSLGPLCVLRIVTSIGLAATIPNAMALIAELAPDRHRNLAVTLGVVCIPLGAAIAGGMAALVLPAFGWQALFLIGGVVALAGLPLFASLPESPRYLARRPERAAERAAVLVRLGLSDLRSEPADDQSAARIRDLVAPRWRTDTLLVWTAILFDLAGVYLLGLWLPTILVASGLGIAGGAGGLMIYSMGGICGAAAAAWISVGLGSRRGIGLVSAGAVISCLLFAASPSLSTIGTIPLVLGLVLLGSFTAATQTAIYALPAYLYPTAIRAGGIAVAATIGRTGAFSSSIVAGTIADRPDAGPLFFLLTAGCLAVAGTAAVLIRRHVPPAVREKTVRHDPRSPA